MRFRFQTNQQVHEVDLIRQGDALRATVDGQVYELEVLDAQPGQLSLRFAGSSTVIYWAMENGRLWMSQNGCTYALDKPEPSRSRLGSGTGGAPGGQEVRAPMPAQVRAIQISTGDAVERGQTLMLLEAMKMEIRIKSPAKGRVARLLVKDEQAVEKDQLLAEIGE